MIPLQEPGKYPPQTLPKPEASMTFSSFPLRLERPEVQEVPQGAKVRV